MLRKMKKKRIPKLSIIFEDSILSSALILVKQTTKG
jgi:hypothetical protein